MAYEMFSVPNAYGIHFFLSAMRFLWYNLHKYIHYSGGRTMAVRSAKIDQKDKMDFQDKNPSEHFEN